MNKKILIAFCLLTLLTFEKAGAQNYIISTVAGNGTAGNMGDNGQALKAQLNLPWGCALDGKGNIYFADYNNAEVRKISPDGRIIPVIDGRNLSSVTGVCADTAGNVYVCDWYRCRIVKANKHDSITTFAGGKYGFAGDGGPADTAHMTEPYDVQVDRWGNVYIADAFNNRIRKVDTKGIITTVAGNGDKNYYGNGGHATSAALNTPVGIAIDTAGNLFIADLGNRVIRKVDKNGIISTVAGNGSYGYSGDNGPATSAQVEQPFDIAVDDSDNIYISDAGINRIRKVSNATGMIYTIAGTGVFGFSGDYGIADSAKLHQAFGLAVDNQGSIYFSDQSNNRIRKLSLCSSNVSLIPASPRICKGSSIDLQLNVVNIYQWAPATGLSSTTGGYISANPTSTTTYSITGTMCTANGTVTVIVDTIPVIKATSSRTTVCLGQTVTLNAIGGTTYRWSPYRALNQVTGATVIAEPGFNTTYVVNGSNGYCSSTDSVILTMGNSFQPGLVTASKDSICPGTPEKLKVSSSLGSIQWQFSDSVPGNYKNIPGATDSTYSFTTTQTAYYRVVDFNGTCGDTSVDYKLNILPAPAVTFTNITKGLQTTFTSAQSGGVVIYSWDFGDNTMSSDSNPVHLYAKDSTYQVCLTAYNGSDCSYTICNKVTVGVSGIASVTQPTEWNIFPNPANEGVTIEMTSTPGKNSYLEIADVLGRVVYTQSWANNKTFVSLNQLASGTYFVRLHSNNINEVKKLVKD